MQPFHMQPFHMQLFHMQLIHMQLFQMQLFHIQLFHMHHGSRSDEGETSLLMLCIEYVLTDCKLTLRDCEGRSIDV